MVYNVRNMRLYTLRVRVATQIVALTERDYNTPRDEGDVI